MRWRSLLTVALLLIGILAIGSGLALYFTVPSGPGLMAPERQLVLDNAAPHQPLTVTIPLQNSTGRPIRVVGIGTC